MRQLPFPDSAFDVILSHWAVHNLQAKPDRTQALAEMVRVARLGASIVVTDIEGHAEYEAEFKRMGLQDVQLVIAPKLRDTLNGLISFGSFQPRTVVARKG